MGLFSGKSKEEELVEELVGGFFTSKDLFNLISANDLKKEFNEKKDSAIANDIQEILKKEVKNGELSFEEIELEFYFLIKQAIYIKNESAVEFHNIMKCPYCEKMFNDYNYCLISCPHCKKGLFDSYIIDYDELDKIKIKLPDEESPYRDMGDELSRYIQKKKPKSNKYKIDQLIPKYAEKLGVSEENCFFVQRLMEEKSGMYDLLAMSVFDDKIGFIDFGDEDFNRGKVIINNNAKDISYISFDDISYINKEDIDVNDDINQLIIKEQPVFLISDIKFSKILHVKFEEYKDKVAEELHQIGNPNKESDKSQSTELPEDVNPMERIKEAKELLDIGAISQEEFDEIKDKYLKHA